MNILQKKLSAFFISSALILSSAACVTDISSPPQTSDTAAPVTTAAPTETATTSVTTTEASSSAAATPAETQPAPAEYVERSYIADDTHVNTIGRTLLSDGIRWISYSASGIEFTFTGDKASVTIVADASIYGEEIHRARFAVWVNGERTLDEMINITEKTYDIFSSDECTETTVKILKLSEPGMSSFGIKEINVGSYGDISPSPEKEHKIEFIGDSITCGYGIDIEDRSQHFSTSIEDATKTYACKTAEALDAEASLVCYSGHGILSGYTNSSQKRNTADLLPPKYEKFGSITSADGMSITASEWDFSVFPADIVVINLGTNDATYTHYDEDKELAFEEEYVKFLYTIRSHYPNAHIICTLGMISDDLCPMIDAAVQYYTAATGDSNISSLRFTPQDGSLGYAADWHPSEATNEVAANLLIEHIKSLNIL